METLGPGKPPRAACRPASRQRKRLQSCSDTESCAPAKPAACKVGARLALACPSCQLAGQGQGCCSAGRLQFCCSKARQRGFASFLQKLSACVGAPRLHVLTAPCLLVPDTAVLRLPVMLTLLPALPLQRTRRGSDAAVQAEFEVASDSPFASAPGSPLAAGTLPCAAPLCPYDLSLFVRWHGTCGRVRINRLRLDPFSHIGQLRGLSRRLVKGAFADAGALPDYLTCEEW